MTMTTIATRALTPHPFRGATPLGSGVEGISVPSVRTRTDVNQDKAVGPAARGRPR